MWKDSNPDEVQALWAADLSAFDAADIKSALATMGHAYPNYPPTLYEFRALCRDAMRARVQTTHRVEYVRYGGPSPEVMAEIHKLTRTMKGETERDPHDWARRILQREANGERMPIYALTSAREVLGVK